MILKKYQSAANKLTIKFEDIIFSTIYPDRNVYRRGRSRNFKTRGGVFLWSGATSYTLSFCSGSREYNTYCKLCMLTAIKICACYAVNVYKNNLQFFFSNIGLVLNQPLVLPVARILMNF